MKQMHFPSVWHARTKPGIIYRNFSHAFSWFMLTACLNFFVGCSYYRVKAYRPEGGQYASRIELMKSQEKFFIFHFGENAWWLKDATIDDSRTFLQGKLARLPFNRMNYLDTDPVRANRYKISDKEVLEEIHIYASEYAEMGQMDVSIPFTAIEKIEVYDHAHDATIASYIFGTIGILSGAFLVLMIIIALTKTSCPFVYSWNGTNYILEGEVFSGATQPGLERHDYLPLPGLVASDGQYKLRVANEVREIQHINLMELMVVDHPSEVKVLIDKYGHAHSLSKLRYPLSAKTFSGTDVLPMVAEKDAYNYPCDQGATSGASLDGLLLAFKKPEGATQAKLVVRAKNSFWIENVFAGFYNMFGRRYHNFSKKQESAPYEQLRKWILDQRIPLSVQIDKQGEWEWQDCFEIAGPMAMKDDILVLNLDGIEGDTVRVKLETGFLFWEIDYVAMDFTQNIPLSVQKVAVSSAIDEQDRDIAWALKEDDRNYYIQPDTGNEAILIFEEPAQVQEGRTLILHSKGYYKILREQKGRPQLSALKTFLQPGRLPAYSRELYEQMNAMAVQTEQR